VTHKAVAPATFLVLLAELQEVAVHHPDACAVLLLLRREGDGGRKACERLLWRGDSREAEQRR